MDPKGQVVEGIRTWDLWLDSQDPLATRSAYAIKNNINVNGVRGKVATAQIEDIKKETIRIWQPLLSWLYMEH